MTQDEFRDIMVDIVMALDPHPPAKANPGEALRIAEEWLAANPREKTNARNGGCDIVYGWFDVDDDGVSGNLV